MRQPTPIMFAAKISEQALDVVRKEMGLGAEDQAWRAVVDFDAALATEGVLTPSLKDAFSSLTPPAAAMAMEMAKSSASFLDPQERVLGTGVPRWNSDLHFYADATLWHAWEGLTGLGMDSLPAQALICKALEKAVFDRALAARAGHEGPQLEEAFDLILKNAGPFPSNEMAAELVFGPLGSWRYRQNFKYRSGNHVPRLYGAQDHGQFAARRLNALAQAWNFLDEEPLSEFAFGCIHSAGALSAAVELGGVKVSTEAQALGARAEAALLEKIAGRATQARARHKAP
jgi:hypothetical protein